MNDLLLTWDFGQYDPLNTNIIIKSTRRDTHDVWQLFNSYVKIGDRDIRLSEVMDIQQREAKNVIPRRNQEYVLRVEFNILGSYIYTSNYIKEVTEKMEKLLPVGFRCVRPQWADRPTASEQYWLIALCLLITCWLMTILFESLWRPLAMLLALMPFTLTVVFLAFYLVGIPFGTGGLAALVLLCGLVINAAIYIMSQYDLIRKNNTVSPFRAYLQAFNHKIVPVMLTILSTVLSLIPFLLDGSENRFWYTFAITIIVGLTASLFALVFIMPWWVRFKR